MNRKNDGGYDYANSKTLFVLKLVTMSFAIFACVVIATAMLTKWIIDLNRAIKESRTKIAKATARLDKYRKSRIKHILKQRKLQRREEKGNKKKDPDELYSDTIDDSDDMTEDEKSIDKFDNELRDIILGETDEET